jgi:carboxyl-terminal processing protease
MNAIAKYFLLAAVLLSPAIAKGQVNDKDFQKFQMAWSLISSFYVDTINKPELAEQAVVAMLKSLDPHSVYISAKEVEAVNQQLNSSFDGIGIEFNILYDTLMVVNTIPGGPSEKVGMKAGDRILTVDGKNIAGIGIKNSDVFKLLRGPKGTQISLGISRKGSSQLLTFKVVRDQIPIYSIDAAYMATNKIGYIKVNKFAANTYDEFAEALKKLQKNKLEGLILDLRGNGGGYLNAAIDMADEFLSNNKMIVYTQGNASPRRDFKATSRGSYEKGPLVVLMDESSASASEIVAGAVQDHDRGIVIGRRSFGKGLVQRQFTLLDGSQIRLTTAKYYTPRDGASKSHTAMDLTPITTKLPSELPMANSPTPIASKQIRAKPTKHSYRAGWFMVAEALCPISLCQSTHRCTQTIIENCLPKVSSTKRLLPI